MHHYIYRQWVDPRRTDLEFGRYLAKLVCVNSTTEIPDTRQVIRIHDTICKQVDGLPTNFEQHPDSVCGPNIHSYDHLQYHKLDPLFRSLIIIIEDKGPDGRPSGGPPKQVKLVKTGLQSPLRTPIDFSRIGESTTSDSNQVTITFSIAIKFVMELDRAEAGITGERPE